MKRNSSLYLSIEYPCIDIFLQYCVFEKIWLNFLLLIYTCMNQQQKTAIIMRIYLFIFVLLASTSLWADEYEVVFSACYGSSQRAIIQGRIIEKRDHAPAEMDKKYMA